MRAGLLVCSICCIVAAAEESALEFGARIVGLSGHGTRSAVAQPMKVIGASLPRTGTLSTKAALEQLGFKVYHMEDFLPNGHGPFAMRAYEPGIAHGERLARVRAWLDAVAELGYNATVDAPLCYLADYIYEVYPEASVLISRRDSAEKWFESYHRLMNVFAPVWGWPLWQLLMRDYPNNYHIYSGCQVSPVRSPSILPWVDLVSRVDVQKDTCVQFYEAVPSMVRRVVRDEGRIVELNVKDADAWAKVCRAARVPDAGCPGGPFPRLNDAESMGVISQALTVAIYVWPLLPLAAAAALLLLLRAVARRCVRAARAAPAEAEARKRQ